MGETANKVLHGACLRLLRPLVRVLLRNGMSCGTFVDLVKWVYVDVASHDFALPSKKQSASRVSVLTGLNRKEVQHLKAIEEADDWAAVEKNNRAARVISGWIRDPEFNDQNGEPAALSIEDSTESRSFSQLVKKYSGDVPHRAIMDELIRVGSLSCDEKGRVMLKGRSYVPGTDSSDNMAIMGEDVADMLACFDHNMRPETQQKYLQLKVCYDNLPAEVMNRFRSLSRKRGQQLMEDLDQWLATYDRDTGSELKGTGRKRAGVGIFYFEEDLEVNKEGLKE